MPTDTASPIADQVKHSVETPANQNGPSPVGPAGASILQWVGWASDQIPEWGTLVQQRDMALRAFLPLEPTAASAFASVCARNAAFSWTLDGPERITKRYQQVLQQANWGRGWVDFIASLTMDLLTQDKGAFIETIRMEDSPASPVVGIRTLDAGSCWVTGNPEVPVIFYDRAKAKYFYLNWYQVVHLREMPMPAPVSTGGRAALQLSALSRALKAIQIRRNIQRYKEEKTGGRNVRAIHIISGIQPAQLDSALARAAIVADGRGQEHYTAPVVITTVDPETDPKLATLEMATMPDAYDAEKDFQEYLTILAMALEIDYQDLAPLPGGNIGTSTQSQILDKKSKAKGAGVFRKLIVHVFNSWILPDNVEMAFDEQDLDEDALAAGNRKLRAEARAQMKVTGEVDALGARQLALDDGDMEQELFDAMGQRDITEQLIRDDERAKVQDEIGTIPGAVKDPGTTSRATGGGAVNPPPAEGTAQPGAKSILEDDDGDRTSAEDKATGIIARQLVAIGRDVKRRIEATE